MQQIELFSTERINFGNATPLPAKTNTPLLKNAKELLEKIYPGAWIELSEKLKRAVLNQDESIISTEYMLMGKVKYVNIKTILTKRLTNYPGYAIDHILREIRQAFDNKKDYNWSDQAKSNSGRDLSIRIKAEGESIKAWYSSEYHNCGNGDYYLLVNPTTAIFCETD